MKKDKRIQKIIELINDCEKVLLKIEQEILTKRIFEDSDNENLINDLTWRFLWNFTLLYYSKDSLDKNIDYDIIQKIQKLDKNFKENFELFEGVDFEIWKEITGDDSHWIFTTPIKRTIDEKLMDILKRVFQRMNSEREHLSPEIIAKYAFNELDYKEKIEVEKHIKNCNECISDIINIRSAAEISAESKVITDSLWKKIEKRLLQKTG